MLLPWTHKVPSMRPKAWLWRSPSCVIFWYLVQAAFKSFTNKFKIITGYSVVHFAEAQIQPKCMKETKQKWSFRA